MLTTATMKRITTLAIGAGAFAGCSSSNATADSSSAASATDASAGLPDRDPQLAKKLVSEGALLLDVRRNDEWNDGHLEGATHIPVQELEGRLDDIDKKVGGDKSKPIVIYCRSGARADSAKDMLLKAGYTQVTNVGGMTDYPAAPCTKC